MNDIRHEQPIADFIKRPPCINHCAQPSIDGEPPVPKLATFGRYCETCYVKTDRQLLAAGDLTEHILHQLAPAGRSEDDGSKRTKKAPPLPFNATAFDDANEIYSALIYWAAVWAVRIKQQMPGPASRAWRNDRNTIIGLPADITEQAARYAVGITAKWLSIHLPDIFRHPFTNDVDEFRLAMADIDRMRARWPMKDRARYVPAIWCWVTVDGEECTSRIGIFPPRRAGADRLIRCDRGHVFTEDEYDGMAKLFRTIRMEQSSAAVREHAKAQRAGERLAKKYLAGA